MLPVIRILICLVICFTSVLCQDDVTVTAKCGKFKGNVQYATEGNIIYRFRGIRYGEAPVGNLRFMPPVPVGNSDEVFDATEDGPACPQPGGLNISEDCLRLNVYTTNLNKDSNRKFPVIFYMHPGGFYGVSGQSIFSGPEYLLNHDVVLVTINYRLGSLGFISTGDENGPGNNGFKDQVLSLKWVKENIAAFGGDPDNVTIMGYSAGSLSVTLHMVSPMSRGLFHKAIAMSASSTAQWMIPQHQMDLAERQAALLNCPTDSSKIIIDCLRTKDFRDIGNTLRDMFELNGNPILLWTPVIEPDCGQERFLSENPTKLIEEGRMYHVPLMTGITEYEFAGPAYAILGDDTDRQMLNNEWNRLAPILFLYERNTTKSLEISTKLKEYYLNSKELKNDEESVIGLRKLYADGVIGYQMHRLANLMANYNTKNTFYYRFSYKGRFSHFYLPSNTTGNKVLGAVHHDDLIYLFNLDTIFPKFNKTDLEYRIVKRLTEMWTNFAKLGSPTLPSTVENITWPPYDRNNKYYLDVGDKLSIDSCLYCDRYGVWDDLFQMSERN